MILTSVLADVEIAGNLYMKRRELSNKEKKFAEWQEAPFRPAELDLELSTDAIPAPDMTSKAFTSWYQFLGGEWLESVVAETLRSLGGEMEVGVGVHVSRTVVSGTRQSEVDVVVIRGHRTYCLSCTTARKIGMCKSKLFEVAIRARQLGGDLARSGLVCLADKDGEGKDVVKMLRSDVADLWGATNTPVVFGLRDLRAWSGAHGAADLSALEDWLES